MPILKNWEIIVEQGDIERVLGAVEASPVVAIDFETTGLDFNRAVIHGVAIATGDQEFYVCLGAEKAILPRLKEILETDKLVVMHNAAFDLHFTNRYQIHPKKVVDTMIGQWLVDENQMVGLKSLAKTKIMIEEDLPDFRELQHLAKKLTKKKLLADISIYDMPLETLAEYACRDARLTLDLWKITERELDREGLLSYFYETAMPFVHLIAEMEASGFYIDTVALDNAEKEFTKKQQDALDEWDRLTDGQINPNSTPQLSKYVYEVLKFKAERFTNSGNPSVDALSLSRMAGLDTTGSISALLTYRKYSKLLSTYVSAFQTQMFGGRLYGNFNMASTVTGRLSSSNPNLQNIPATGDDGKLIRSLFQAAPGRQIVVIDYSQIELRLLAHYTKDVNMLRVFAENGDPHQMTADLIGIERKYAKSVNFGWAYGIGPRKLQDSVESASGTRPSQEQAKAWLDGFAKAYPQAVRWKYRVIEYARELGYVKTISGRKRRLPDITSNDKMLAGYAERQAINTIIQGSAADIIAYAMLQIRPLHQGYSALILGQVHDELIWEVPTQYAEEFAAKASALMVGAGEHFGLRVALIAEPGIGESWADAK